MQTWLYLHFPSLQLDTIFTEDERPLVLVKGRDHHIVQASSAAIEEGIQLGMGLGAAASLCAQLQVQPYEPKQEAAMLEHLAQWLYLVTSDIVLFPPQGLLLKVTDMLTLYSGLENYGKAVQQHLANYPTHHPLRYGYATGFSPLSAMLLAKQAENMLTLDGEKLRARILTYPLSATELSLQHQEKLSRVGIRLVSDLIALPMQEIARRFDIDLVNYVGRLLGQFHHPLPFYHPKEQFHGHLELLYEITNIQWLEKPLTQLLQQLEMFLLLRNQVAYELALTLIQRDKKQETLTFTSAQGDYHTDRWLTLCRLTMESIKLEHPVMALTLKVVRSATASSEARDLFQGNKGRQSSLELIGLLQAKLGTEHVFRPARSDDPRPEKATSYVDPIVTPPATHRQAQLRPTWLYPTPEALIEQVTLIHGPERIATGWWDGEAIIRDYFIAQSAQGRWLWVFRTPEQQWFIHGLFS